MLKMIFTAVKTTAAAVVMLLAVTTTVSAQDRIKAGGDAGKRQADVMKTELSLNDDQYNKVVAINKEFADKAKETRQTAVADQKEARAERAKAVKALSDEKDAKLKAVLTEDQYKTYLAKKEERKNAAKARRFDNGRSLPAAPSNVAPQKQ